MLTTGNGLEQVTGTITPFWDEFKIMREKFYDLGDDAWRDAVTVIDLGTTPHTWLSTQVSATETIKDEIVNRLTY